MPQITTITSEALQATVRRLLPSQQGFGVDLEAQNVIVPIVDLTPTAEGSFLPSYLQTAYSFGNITFDQAQNGASVTIINNPGFWKYNISSTVISNSASNRSNAIQITNGLATKNLHAHVVFADSISGSVELSTEDFEGVVYLTTGDSIVLNSDVRSSIDATFIPIADANGNLINPNGFTAE